MDKKISRIGYVGTAISMSSVIETVIKTNTPMILIDPYKDLREPRLPEFFKTSQHDKLREHIKGKRSVLDEYKLIKSKQSDLSRSMRDFVIGLIEEEE